MQIKKTLLYYDIAEKVKSLIIKEGLPVGALLPSERNLSGEFGVSMVTLRKSLECLETEGIIEKLPRRGNMVIALPRSENRNHKKRIGVTIWQDAGLHHPVTLKVLSLIGEEFSSDIYEIILLYVSRPMIEKNDWDAVIGDHGLDGMLVQVQEIPPETLRRIQALPIPAVFINRQGFSPGVWADEIPAMDKLIGYLSAMGHKRIAYINGLADIPITKSISNAFIAVHEAQGLVLDRDLLVFAEFSERSGREETVRLLDSPAPPTAILLGDEFMVMGAYKALAERGLKCPADISIICTGDNGLAEQLHPAVTSLRGSGIFRSGVRMLRQMIENEGQVPKGNLILERELIIRASTDRAKSALT